MAIKFQSFSLNEDNRLKAFEGRVQNNIGGSDTGTNRKKKTE
jgi:hypothetical protein